LEKKLLVMMAFLTPMGCRKDFIPVFNILSKKKKDGKIYYIEMPQYTDKHAINQLHPILVVIIKKITKRNENKQ